MFKYFKMRTNLSLRTKIILLVTLSLAVSGFAYVFVGARLIIQDKTSYIYDYAASQVGVIANQLETRLSPLNELAYVMDKRNLAADSPFVQSIAALLKLKVTEGEIVGEGAEFLALNISKETKALDVGVNLVGRKKVTFTDERPILDVEAVSKDFSVCVISPKAKKVLYSLERDAFREVSNCGEIIGAFSSSFLKGAQEIALKDKPFILSYENILDGNILVISMVPMDAAFVSARNLVSRSSLLGLTLFFFAVGVCLLVVRTIVSRINELIQATQKISSGDFELRLETRANTRDEVSLLSNAFNLMSDKIKILLQQTADKARMEKELETAQMVQNQFFPDALLNDDRLRIEGRSVSATECGGDFWQFARIGDHVLFLFGDITGHGLPSALLTAAVYAVFASYTHQLKKQPSAILNGEAVLKGLSEVLNETIYGISKGQLGFSGVGCLLDLKTRKFFIVNHGHPAPYRWQPEKKAWGSVVVPVSPLLGYSELGEVKVSVLELPPETNLFFYTDGLFDQRPSDSAHLNKKAILERLAQAKAGANPALVDLVMNEAIGFFGKESASRPDDITLVSIQA